ncbi:putative C4-dicarboxylate transport protein [Liberibacter crescens BT-1]|uniref:C4-dicarboxylate transport protein n=1 Tax=Liberibacter crescens (strain BT-1) TaxID=1215343 RepID=L0ETR8_LIBCB|nr:C4-dicarboxylate transporter DctA [Liberibacter crescens]AGA64362.1 putative C4-dicarboxylate transport protein [Liberibacter crescens BT-1]
MIIMSQANIQKKIWKNLYLQVVIAIIIGILLGCFYPKVAIQFKIFGDFFIKLTKMIIAPVIFLTVTTAIARMIDIKKVGNIVGKSMIYFFLLSTLALIIGIIVADVIKPGAGMNVDVSSLNVKDIFTYTQKAHEQSISAFLLDIVPDTVFSAFISGNILQVLLIAGLFGISLVLAGEKAHPIKEFLEDITLPLFKMVNIIMKAAPIGAFGAISFTISKYGLASIANLALLISCFYITSILFVVIILGAIAYYNGFSIIRLIRYLKEELLLVLSTSSSESALASLMQKMEQAGCNRSIVSIVVPTGYSFNLDGTNIYMTLASLFIAQATNTHLTFTDEIILLLVAMISSKGAAGVTGAGFITLAATLSALPTIPVAGMALILGIDRFMSECRSLTNFIGNAVACVVISRLENAIDEKEFSKTLGRSKTIASKSYA